MPRWFIHSHNFTICHLSGLIYLCHNGEQEMDLVFQMAKAKVGTNDELIIDWGLFIQQVIIERLLLSNSIDQRVNLLYWRQGKYQGYLILMKWINILLLFVFTIIFYHSLLNSAIKLSIFYKIYYSTNQNYQFAKGSKSCFKAVFMS